MVVPIFGRSGKNVLEMWSYTIIISSPDNTSGKLYNHFFFNITRNTVLKYEDNSAYSKYSGTRLIRTPKGHAKVSVLTGVRIKRVNFRENV